MSTLSVDRIETPQPGLIHDTEAPPYMDLADWIGSEGVGWLSYNQQTPATLGSVNVSSVTDENAGDYTVNLTNAASASIWPTSHCAITALSSGASVFTTGWVSAVTQARTATSFPWR